jgi:glutathione S-transferase
LDLSREVCDRGGLAWSRRLQLVHAGLHDASGFPPRIARYLAHKYGYDPATGADHADHVAHALRKLSERLTAQRRLGSAYLVGDSLSAADIYCATAMAMFDPLAPEHCAMDEAMRVAFSSRDAQIEASLAPLLLEHRAMMYSRHLPLPLSL